MEMLLLLLWGIIRGISGNETDINGIMIRGIDRANYMSFFSAFKHDMTEKNAYIPAAVPALAWSRDPRSPRWE